MDSGGLFPKIAPLPGSLQIEWKRCGKGSCRCARGELHGPYAYLFWRERGRLRKRYVRFAEVERVRASCEKRRLRQREFRRDRDDARRAWRTLLTAIRGYERDG